MAAVNKDRLDLMGRSSMRRASRGALEVCAEAGTAEELVNGLREPLNDALGLAGMYLGATDPDTTIFATAAVIENLPDSMCAPWMHNEFLEDDFNKFADLHRTEAPVTTLQRATQHRPNLSPRHTDLNQPVGFGPELRTTFSHGGFCWGVANLLRESGADDFEEDSITWLEQLRPAIAAAFQRTVVVSSPPGGDEVIPGVITLDPEGRVLSMTASAEPLLAELRGHAVAAGPDHRLPNEAYMVATLARARASGRGDALRPVTRLQGESGRWITVRGDYTLTTSGDLANIVLVIDPSRPAEIMPLVVAAYCLTPREQEVLTELSSGRTTGEIAIRLFISEHTVRDHIKSILAKTNTSSRGELLSRLFHDHAYEITEFTQI